MTIMEKWLFKIAMRDGKEYNIFFVNKAQKNKIIHFINTRSVIDYDIIDGCHECWEFLKLARDPIIDKVKEEILWIKNT